MLHKRTVILLLAIISFSGCRKGGLRLPFTPAAGPQETLRYLYNQEIPAIKSIEIWQSDFGPGLLITTAHYEIHTTLLDPLMLAQLPAFMEHAHRGYQSQLPQPIETNTKFTIYLFATRKQWEDFTTTFTGPNAPLYLKIKAGAYYLNGACVTYNIGRSRTFSVLGHEGWHQFNSRHFTYRLPSWLDEGIATLFEVNKYENGKFKFVPDRNIARLAVLRDAMEKNKMIPLKDLITSNPAEALIGENTESIRSFYAQSYALVRFLREQGHGRSLKRYHQMLLGGLSGTWPLTDEQKIIAADRNIPLTTGWNRIVAEKLFSHYITENTDAIEKWYWLFCNNLTYRLSREK